MTIEFGIWTLGLDGGEAPSRDLIGGKAWSVARMRAFGLNVPPAFVVTTRACAAYLATGAMPQTLAEEIAAAIAWLETQTSRSFGRGPQPLLVSVRSGAPISMPGMMDTDPPAAAMISRQRAGSASGARSISPVLRTMRA